MTARAIKGNVGKLLSILQRNAVAEPPCVAPQLTSEDRSRLARELCQARAYRREHPDWFPPRGMGRWQRRRLVDRMAYLDSFADAGKEEANP